MDSKKPNKITEIVRLQQILNKWKKLAAAGNNGTSKLVAKSSSTSLSPSSTNSNHTTATNTTSNSSGSSSSFSTTTSKSIKFLKKTLSFSERESNNSQNNIIGAADVVLQVPKGCVAVCVGEELKRFVIPMEYLGHQAFGILLREAEEEFGFQQEGVLKIPCQVCVFEKILKMMMDERSSLLRDNTPSTFHLHDFCFTTTSALDGAGEVLLDMKNLNAAAAGTTGNNGKNIVGYHQHSPPPPDRELTQPPSHAQQAPQMCR